MTRQAAALNLAEGVMGWSVIDASACPNELRSAHTLICGKHSVLYYWRWVLHDPRRNYQLGGRYDPWTDDCQALALAKVWPYNITINKWEDMLPCDRYQALAWDKQGKCHVCHNETLAAALTGAVCKAEGLEVKDAQ